MRNLIKILVFFLLVNISFALKPNIIVFLVDDMGAMDTSVAFMADENGNAKSYELNKMYRTPSMEALSERGARFSRAYAMSVCSPSRVSIMTGKTSARHTVTNFIKAEANNGGAYGPRNWGWEGISEKDKTMPMYLKDAGYKTIFIGKAHFAPIGKFGTDPLNLGYDVNIGGCAWGQPGSYLGTANFGNKTVKAKVNRGVPHLEKYHGKDIFLTEALTLEAIEQIKIAKTEGKPFLLSMSHYAVHSPFIADKRFTANYADAKAPKDWKSFATLIEGMDKSLGDLMQTLEDEGIAEDTLIIFLGDNGTDNRLHAQSTGIGNAAPMRGMKATRSEGGLRIPFIISWAKNNPNNEKQNKFHISQNTFNATDLVAVYDVFSTVLDVAGIKAEGEIDGISLFDVIAKPNANKDRGFLMHFPHEHRNNYFTSYIEGDWKVIKDWQNDEFELYNLASDLSESNDLSKTNPEKLKEMIVKMDTALADAHAQSPDFSSKSNMLGKGAPPVAKKDKK